MVGDSEVQLGGRQQAGRGAHLSEAEEEPNPSQDLQHFVGMIQHQVPTQGAGCLLTCLSGLCNENRFSIQ